ncbi:MAG: hypothetical protein IPO31_01505 [Candidatus Obscuribacter sp.]|nr:hypothetical protein [Candidatus Obscuribacter sp.]
MSAQNNKFGRGFYNYLPLPLTTINATSGGAKNLIGRAVMPIPAGSVLKPKNACPRGCPHKNKSSGLLGAKQPLVMIEQDL